MGQKLSYEKRFEIASRLCEALRSLYQDRVVTLSDTRALASQHLRDIKSAGVLHFVSEFRLPLLGQNIDQRRGAQEESNCRANRLL